MTVVDTNTNTFTSTPSIGPLSDSGGISYGRAFYVPVFGSGQGIVVAIGGRVENSAMRDMAVITLFDPATQEWYTQTATGDIPSPKEFFCITGAQSTNGSTYEMFVNSISYIPIPYSHRY